MALNFPTHGTLPGISTLSQTTEKVIWFGRQENLLYLANNIIGAAAVDDGNTPTTTLRAGLAMGRKTSDSLLYEWDPDATDGTENFEGVLIEEINMLNAAGSTERRSANVLAAGAIKAPDILIEGTVLTSSADEHRFRALAAGRYHLSDDLQTRFWLPPMYRRVIAKTADYTILKADNGTLFTNSGAAGAVIFTTPTNANSGGMRFGVLVVTDQSVTVASGTADSIIWKNDAAVDSLAFSTMSEKIGGHLLFEFSPHLDKWFVYYLGPPDLTVTAAT